MPNYKKDPVAEEIKRRISIKDLFEEWGCTFDSKGKTRCPLHGEKTASLQIYEATNTFYCFGCGAGGDVLTAYQKLNGCDFPTAKRDLAQRAGIVPTAEQGTPERKKVDADAQRALELLQKHKELAREQVAALSVMRSYEPETSAYAIAKAHFDDITNRIREVQAEQQNVPFVLSSEWIRDIQGTEVK